MSDSGTAGVEVRYFAGLVDLAGVQTEHFVDVADLDGLRAAIIERHGPKIEKSISVSSFLANGKRLAKAQSLDGVAAVDALPPFAGG